MEKMHYNKQCNDLIQNDINDQNTTSYTPSKKRKEIGAEINDKNSDTILSAEEHTKNSNKIKQHEASDIGIYTGTSTSCTSSTDSGVNISDNDEIPPSPISSHLNSFPSSTSSSSEATTVNPFNKQFHKNNKHNNRDNNINNKKGNNYNNNIFNGDNDIYDDYAHDDEDIHNNSTSSDNKLKSEEHRKRLQEQQFLKVENSSKGENNTRYQQYQNITKSENVTNISDQRNLQTPTTSVTSITKITAKSTNKDTPLLQHNEFINTPQRSASTSSSLSMSSIMSTNSDDKINPPHKIHHCRGSPVVSIRSINSTIITSDSDSDLDLYGDTEGVHSNYVIKKLGTQVTYPPKHPDIPNINSGHTVLNQQVIPNCNDVPASPLAALAAIGDRIGAAQALGPVPSFSADPQRPQIGSIALSNSSDVTFGDKHFYEGPVTIQQFLIDGRDKWKETNGKENPTFVSDNGEPSNNAKDINSSAEQSGKLCRYISKRKKLIIPGVLAVMTLLIVATVLGSKALSDSKNTNGHHANDDDECSGNGTLCLINRDVWRAHPQKKNLDKQVLPLHRVVISHTASESCETIRICAERVRVIQEFHMNSLGWDDIGYNFLISSDGRVYVGRGWDAVGAHTKGYNYDSVGITFIGTYMTTPPTEAQLNACLALLDEGLRLNKLAPDYHIYGARQLGSTESPGHMLYNIIKKWKHWSVDVKHEETPKV